MPILREAVVDEVLAPVTASWERRGCEIEVLPASVGADSEENQCTSTLQMTRGAMTGSSFPNARKTCRSEWAAALKEEDLAIKWEKVQFWPKSRPDFLMVRRKQFQAEDDLTLFGVSAVMGRAPEMDASVSQASKTFHTVRRRLVCRFDVAALHLRGRVVVPMGGIGCPGAGLAAVWVPAPGGG